MHLIISFIPVIVWFPIKYKYCILNKKWILIVFLIDSVFLWINGVSWYLFWILWFYFSSKIILILMQNILNILLFSGYFSEHSGLEKAIELQDISPNWIIDTGKVHSLYNTSTFINDGIIRTRTHLIGRKYYSYKWKLHYLFTSF